MTVAMDAMAVAIHIKYALNLNRYVTFYWSAKHDF